jgi:hypothetical protein
MSAWIDVVVSHLYPWPIGVLITGSALSLIVGMSGLWALWRVRRLLTVVPVLQERIETLSHSMALLTDTTESCFKALSMQLQFMQTQQSQQAREVGPLARARVQAPAVAHEEGGTRKARQRRVIGAARRGEALAAIAAREEVSESEVALRVHLNQQPPAAAAAAEIKRHGALLS